MVPWAIGGELSEKRLNNPVLAFVNGGRVSMFRPGLKRANGTTQSSITCTSESVEKVGH